MTTSESTLPKSSTKGLTQHKLQIERNDSILIHLLLGIVVVELAIHRVAVPALLPPRGAPPTWHMVLSWIGNFCFFFASILAVAVLIREFVLMLWRKRPCSRGFSVLLTLLSGSFLLIALLTLLVSSSETLIFAINGSYAVAIAAIVIAQIPPRGDIGARIGVVLLAIPLVIHFYAPFALRYISGDDLGLPLRVQTFGQWSLVFSALAVPYCFAPRPFAIAVSRLSPLLITLFATVMATIVMRRATEEGMILAQDGFGITLDPLAPASMLALYLMGLAAVTWTLASCLASRSHHRRMIGAGLGLVVFGGYAFEWSLQYLLGIVGLLVIGTASRLVDDEEKSGVANKVDVSRSASEVEEVEEVVDAT